MMTIRGIDISNWQAGIDLAKVKSDGVLFAICKLSEGQTFVDKSFNAFHEQAMAIGLPIGAYVYSHATTPSAAVAEANFALKLLNGRELPLGIYMDIETDEQMAISKEALSETVRAFCDTVESAGYISGIYGSEYRTWGKIAPSDFPNSIIWVAHYGKQPAFPCDLWQRSDQGTVQGFSGHVDMDDVMSERMASLINREKPEPAYKPPIKDPVQATFPPDPSIFGIQLIMWYNGYLDESEINGHKSQAFFEKLDRFVNDMKNC